MPLTLSHLPRLPRPYYLGASTVFWTHSIQHRATGWLTVSFHSAFREKLIHACSRYRIACPLYVLMPDHWHFVWMGLAESSDQLRASRFLRQHIAPSLLPAVLRQQAHDHVLRGRDRNPGALMDCCNYIRNNPVRAGLVESAEEWWASGSIVAGYPDLDPNSTDFWDKYWRIHNRLVTKSDPRALTSAATTLPIPPAP